MRGLARFYRGGVYVAERARLQDKCMYFLIGRWYKQMWQEGQRQRGGEEKKASQNRRCVGTKLIPA